MNIKERKLIFIVMLITLFSTNQIFGQIEKLRVNEWITSWHLLGPLSLEEGSSEVHHKDTGLFIHFTNSCLLRNSMKNILNTTV